MKDIEELYNNKKEKWLKILTRQTRNDQDSAEDILQTAFVYAIQYYHKYSPKKGKLENWFAGIVFNELNRWKKLPITVDIDRYKWIEEDMDYLYLIENASYLEKKIKEEGFHSSRLKELSLEMIYLKGYSARETSKILKIPEVNIRQWCHRFREGLKDGNT